MCNEHVTTNLCSMQLGVAVIIAIFQPISRYIALQRNAYI